MDPGNVKVGNGELEILGIIGKNRGNDGGRREDGRWRIEEQAAKQIRRIRASMRIRAVSAMSGAPRSSGAGAKYFSNRWPPGHPALAD